MKRNLNDIFIYSGRNYIKTEQGIIAYAVYVAKNNPEICGEWFDGCEVHHIDGNKLNDIPQNLICLSKEDHHRVHTKTVVAFKNNKFLGKYASETECASTLNIDISAISYYCKHQMAISPAFSDYRFAFSN